MKKSVIIEALRRLGELAEAEGLLVEITIYGGVAMMLHFDSRIATKDIDAIFRPRKEVLRLARRVQMELDLPDGWLEDDVGQFLSHEMVATESKVTPLSLPKELNAVRGLRLTVPSPRYLIAMKARSLRRSLPGVDGDREDLIVLFRHENIRSADAVSDIIEEYFADYLLDAKGRLIVEDLIATAHTKKRPS